MNKNSMNVFEFIFATFFILKITKTGIVSDWNWFFVFLPLIANIVFRFFNWIFETLNLKRSANVAIQDMYIDNIRKKAVKKYEDSLKK